MPEILQQCIVLMGASLKGSLNKKKSGMLCVAPVLVIND